MRKLVDFGKTLSAVVLLNAMADGYAGNPNWMLNGSYVNVGATVEEVNTEAKIDLIKLSSGAQSNFRTGANCEVYRGGAMIGKITIIAAETGTAIGVQSEGEKIQAGDSVYLSIAD